MSSKNQYEDHGLRHKGSCYTTLIKAWEYSCPHKNVNYAGFSGGINCLCAGIPMERSSGDQAIISGKKWPLAKPTNKPNLGWKN